MDLSFSKNQLLDRIDHIQSIVSACCYKANRDPQDIKILAVTKNWPDRLADGSHPWACLAEAGLWGVGENYLQQAKPKINAWQAIHALAEPKALHIECIGHLQSNKTALAAQLFTRIQSVDRINTLTLLNRYYQQHLRRNLNLHAPSNLPPQLSILLQINTSEEPQKSGACVADAPALLAYALHECPLLKVEGLMTMAAINKPSLDPFNRLKHLQMSLQDQFQYPLPELSMGMSQDFTAAIQAGSTLIRLGSILNPLEKACF